MLENSNRLIYMLFPLKPCVRGISHSHVWLPEGNHVYRHRAGPGSSVSPGCLKIMDWHWLYCRKVINIPAEGKPRERFDCWFPGESQSPVIYSIKCCSEVVWSLNFGQKKWMQNLLNFEISLQIPCASDVDSTSFFNTHRRLSDPSVGKPSLTANCYYGTHNATASNAGIAWHLCSALPLSANC